LKLLDTELFCAIFTITTKETLALQLIEQVGLDFVSVALLFVFLAWRRGGDHTQGATYRRASPWNPCDALLSRTFNH